MLKIESIAARKPLNFVIPRAEVEYLRHVVGPERDDLQLYATIAFNRLANKICSQCGNKTDVSRLIECSECQLTHYCNRECMDQHATTHQRWCCQPDGKRDSGYLQVVILETK